MPSEAVKWPHIGGYGAVLPTTEGGNEAEIRCVGLFPQPALTMRLGEINCSIKLIFFSSTTNNKRQIINASQIAAIKSNVSFFTRLILALMKRFRRSRSRATAMYEI